MEPPDGEPHKDHLEPNNVVASNVGKLSSLVSFYRNKTYRKHIGKCLRGKEVDVSVLDHFDASLAVWRYETVWSVFLQLLRVRLISEEWLQPEMFQHVQDRVMIDAAMAAAKSKELWRLMAGTFKEVVEPTEKLRRWGMVCDCENHVRARREDRVKHISCWRNSRRMKDAATEINTEVARDRARARALTPADCEGDRDACKKVSDVLNLKVVELRLRGRYFSIAPWCFVQCGTEAGAQHCLDQVARFPMESHDPVTQWLVTTFDQAVREVAQGGAVSDALKEELELWELFPLDESAGEGVHRSDTLEKTRACGSTIIHIKQSARERQVSNRLETFLGKYGVQGRRVLRFEFHAWKRILQVRPSKQWQPPKQLKAREALSRIYREDEMAEQDWSAICKTAPAHERGESEKQSDEVALANEYLVATLQRNQVYSVTAPKVELNPDGQSHAVQGTTFFA